MIACVNRATGLLGSCVNNGRLMRKRGQGGGCRRSADDRTICSRTDRNFFFTFFDLFIFIFTFWALVFRPRRQTGCVCVGGV